MPHMRDAFGRARPCLRPRHSPAITVRPTTLLQYLGASHRSQHVAVLYNNTIPRLDYAERRAHFLFDTVAGSP